VSDRGYSVQQTTDGGYVITGFVDWGDGDTTMNLYLIKTDSLGDTLWTGVYGSDTVQYEGHFVQQTSDGGYFVAGHAEPSVHGLGDAYAWKFSSDGQVEWEKAFGGRYHDIGLSGQQTTDGGFIILGSTYSFLPDCQMYLIKTNALGDTVWTRVLGSSYVTGGRWVEQTADGGYIVAGGARIGPVHGFLLIKTNSAGMPEWQKFHDLTPERDEACAGQQTTDGGYIVTGRSWSPSGNHEIVLLKTDPLGEKLWSGLYGTGMFADEGRSVRQTFDGGYVIAGCTEPFGPGVRDVYLLKTDSLGVALWDTTFGTPGWDEGWSIQQTADSGYVIAGNADWLGGETALDVYLVKTGRQGQIIPKKDVAVTNIIMPPDSVFPDTSCQMRARVKNMGNALDSFTVTAVIDGYSDTLVICGLGSGLSINVSFRDWHVPADDSMTYLMTVCAETEDDLDTTNDCMEKEIFAYNPTGVEERLDRRGEFGFHLCQNEPNPFHRSTVIEYSLPTQCEVSLSLYDVTGSLVHKLVDELQGPGFYRAHWDPQGCADGIYFCRLMAGNLTETRKMVLAR